MLAECLGELAAQPGVVVGELPIAFQRLVQACPQ